MKKICAYRTLILFFASTILSRIITSIFYLGYRVVEASMKGLLPLDSEELYADWQAVLRNPIYAYIPIALICLLFYAVKRKTIMQKVSSQKVTWFEYVRLFVFSISLGYFLRSSLSYIVNYLIDGNYIDKNSLINSALSVSSGTQEYLLQLFVMVVLVPFYEELLFRKMLVNDLLNEHDKKTALILALALFAVLHSGINFFYALAIGAVTVFTYSSYGNIKLTMLIHASFNFIGTINLDFIQTISYTEWLFYGLSIGSVLYYIVDFIVKRQKNIW